MSQVSTSKTSTSSSNANANKSALLDKKIEETAAGLQKFYTELLHSINKDNADAIVEYIAAMKNEVNLSDHYKKDLIILLCKFSRDNKNKLFKDLTRTDIISFLDTYRKTEAADPMHKWIGTYNLYRIHLLRFFKWLYHPDIEPGKRPKSSVIENIPELKRKEKSIYKPSDLWTQQDDLLFLKYCPSKRDKCYHAISRDSSCRPQTIKIR